jgi:hypothetical protein
MAFFLHAVPLNKAQVLVTEPLRAPTYYIGVEAPTCEPDMVKFVGASNLPPGAKLLIGVADFYEYAWKNYSEDITATLDDQGFFRGSVQPKKGLVFRRNLLLVANFATYEPKQPNNVLQIVGRKGERLGGLENPQRIQVSGPYFGIQAIARVPFCGEGLDKKQSQ